MIICGLQKTTLLDYPGCVAATIFVGGCNMRCVFCHNMNIAALTDYDIIEENQIFDFLKKRQGILDGVCITGGEPTIYPGLPDFIRRIKALGYKIKLDTNGTNPHMLSLLISEGLIDYVAMDIKSSLSEYNRICNSHINTNSVKESVNILNSSTIDHEFRTTVVSNYHTSVTFEEIANLIKGAEKYYLQPFTDSDSVPDHTLLAPTKEELLAYRKQLLEVIPIVEVRGEVID